MFSPHDLKLAAARAAIDLIEPYLLPGIVIGVGTGSTADLFIDGLGAHQGRFRGAVASSERSAARLRGHGIDVLDLNAVTAMPVYVDGADEINAKLQMIKGGGGALTREKIVASVAERFICIADESKLVAQLGSFPLPVEVIPMAREAVARQARIARRIRHRQRQRDPGCFRPGHPGRVPARIGHQQSAGRRDQWIVRASPCGCRAARHPERRAAAMSRSIGAGAVFLICGRIHKTVIVPSYTSQDEARLG